MQFAKYHGLGNDYIVMEEEGKRKLTKERIRTICHRNYGVGSDGILLKTETEHGEDFSLRIFNPDGSEAEKSGNGLRIFTRYLWDRKLVGERPFSIRTLGGSVTAKVHEEGKFFSVAMGKVSFQADEIPVRGFEGEVVNRKMTVEGREFTFSAATVGNPHCVILCDEMDRELALRYGPHIETNALFPNRTNVQFMRILNRNTIQLEIWERGAGYTLASGSSGSAAASVACRLGLCDGQVRVRSPGGVLDITIGEGYEVTMKGPVAKVAEGTLADEMFA